MLKEIGIGGGLGIIAGLFLLGLNVYPLLILLVLLFVLFKMVEVKGGIQFGQLKGGNSRDRNVISFRTSAGKCCQAGAT